MSEAGPANLPMGAWPEVQAVPGAREALAALHGRLPLCIATNASVSNTGQIEQALGRVGLAGFFSHIFCFSDLGRRKDDPLFWDAVAARLGVPLAAIAMVGDSLEQDVLAPARFGVQSVWFDTSRPAAGAHVPTVDDLREFSRLVLQAA